MNAIPLEREIEYPTSDGQPMAETLEHQQVMIDLIEGLRSRYAGVPGAWVAGNFFFCYEKGNPNAHVSPDVMVAEGLAPKELRLNYLLWDEKPPSLVVEVTSRSTRREDTGKKKSLYERIGTQEYVLFDPFGEYLRSRLQGYWLERSKFHPIPLEADGTLHSRTTGLTFRPEGLRLRLVDTATGRPILWHEELEAAFAQQTAANRAAEERIRALEAELSRLRHQ
ncbi:MAG TPA: Uma2 family endonuclease [Thermoanaerobaculia bacterium]|nr:Uma2 family endonuclease [Thermoanaerobaculia bacterium]